MCGITGYWARRGDPNPWLADLAGSVREVVARALRELRDADIVRVDRSGITVLDAAALAARAWPRDLGH